MANTYTCLHYHVIFSTKNRERWLTADVQPRIWAYLGGIAREHRLVRLTIGGIEDHVHLVLSVPPSIALSKALQFIKGGSSKWIHETFPMLHGYGWQDSYGAFTVSKSNVAEVVKYVEDQREHHRHKTFQEEVRAFLDRYEVDYDERYVWGWGMLRSGVATRRRRGCVSGPGVQTPGYRHGLTKRDGTREPRSETSSYRRSIAK